jgi:hypothetical protein
VLSTVAAVSCHAVLSLSTVLCVAGSWHASLQADCTMRARGEPAVCSAVDLTDYSSPVTGTTSSASNVFNPSCGAGSYGANDIIFTLSVPPGATIWFEQSSNDYDSVHELRYGGACPGSNYVECVDDPDLTAVSWTNTASSAQPVYYVQSGYYTSEGNFTLTWAFASAGESRVPCRSPVRASALTGG